MKTLVAIKKELGRSKSTLIEKYSIKSIAILGPFARNEQPQGSDPNILVHFKDGIGIPFIDLAYKIESQLDLIIDLVPRNGVKEKYLKTIDEYLIYD